MESTSSQTLTRILDGPKPDQSYIRWAPSFEIKSEAGRLFVGGRTVREELSQSYQQAKPEDPNDLMVRSFAIARLLKNTPLPQQLCEELAKQCQNLGFGDETVLLLRSVEASPFDNPSRVQGPKSLEQALKKLYQEHFSNALIQRFEKPDYDPFSQVPQLVVQEGVNAARTGLALTLEPKSGAADFVVVYSTWGIAEDILRRTVARDEFWFHTHSLKQGRELPLYRTCGNKEFQLYYDPERHRLEHLDLSRDKSRRYSLNPGEALRLARYALALQGQDSTPLEISWAADQDTLSVLSTRSLEAPPVKSLRLYQRVGSGPELLRGRPVSHSVAQGRVRVIHSRSELEEFQDGEILVAKKTEPDWEPGFRRAAAIITEHDRRVSHSTILAREMGIPAVLNAQGCGERLRTGQRVTVSCCEGDQGIVYEGEVAHRVKEFSLDRMPDLKTSLMVNLSLPERALSVARLPWAGAGLVRSEFIIGGWVKIHPLALLYPKKLDSDTRRAVDRIRGEQKGADYFVDRMSQALGLIAAAFWPRPVTFRFSDLKSSEYARLLGGRGFEPEESNAMMGWRGASRYLHPDYQEAFLLELQAIKRVTTEMGFDNLRTLVPFCRTPEEGEELLELIREHTAKTPLEVWCMAELPSNVILASEFAQAFDGLSIGSSDLTSLTLGVARDAEHLSQQFDEMHPAMLRCYETIIEAAHQHNKPVSFCGQAASEDTEFAALLAEMNVDILSLAPDALHPTLQRLEKR